MRQTYTFCESLSGKLIVVLVLVALAATAAGAAERRRRTLGTVSRAYAEARALFEKLWVPGEPSPAGGDGLGPLYNERSCVGCHHLGGTGGAGGLENNVMLVSSFAGAAGREMGADVFQGELEALHPGFKNSTSVVAHRFAVAPGDEALLTKLRNCSTVQTRDALIALSTSSRNSPALFGAGVIDAITDEAILAAEQRRFTQFPEIKGRVSRLRDGRLGRFGWKGQTATLREFVLGACSNELGLEVPGHHQVSLEPAADFKPAKLKLDLDASDCELLTEFVRGLPRPIYAPVVIGSLPGQGRVVFDAIGCAVCHAPRLGSVNGLFSDLLLHDLGDRVRDFGGGYGGPTTSRVVDLASSADGPRPSGDAGPREWRTPPLWGVADSVPYLHDGRARTLDDAIRLHGGEAAKTSERYTQLAHGQQQALLAFLHSLKAPEQQPRRLANYAVRRTRGAR